MCMTLSIRTRLDLDLKRASADGTNAGGLLEGPTADIL